MVEFDKMRYGYVSAFNVPELMQEFTDLQDDNPYVVYRMVNVTVDPDDGSYFYLFYSYIDNTEYYSDEDYDNILAQAKKECKEGQYPQ